MAKRQRRFIISSDHHRFVTRMNDLSSVSMHFDSYEKAAKYPDAKYILDVNERASLLAQRVESLNHVGDLLWPKVRVRIEALPMSAYEYCNLIQDAFLMRTISILDCCCLLAVEVLELSIKPRKANIEKISNLSVNHPCCEKLQALFDLQTDLRFERNVRFHRGEEQAFTDDDATFKLAALFKHRGQDMTGTDQHGRKIDLTRSYAETIYQLRRKFVVNVKGVSKSLDRFYDTISDEFENRFRVKFRATGSFGSMHGVRGDD
jgi:hypothetical protein